ncbi:MAG: hypothetical protein ACI8P9_003584 [Parasphingorhabdus sp.]|jgi:hypothetical protein
MTKYNDKISLDTQDIDLIEIALRKQVAGISLSNLNSFPDFPRNDESSVSNIQKLLAKIHHQKIFYSSVNKTNSPMG